MKLKLLALLASAALVKSAMAMDDISLGIPGYAGPGCPPGSASASLTDDKKTLSILFDQFLVNVGGNTGKTNARTKCDISVPVHVPQGIQVSLITVDYRGYNLLPAGASSEFSVEYFFAGQRGPKYTKTFYGEMDEDYIVTNKLIASSMVWSRCGEQVILRVNPNLKIIKAAVACN